MAKLNPASRTWHQGHRVAIPAALLAAVWLATLTLGTGPLDGLLLAATYAGDQPLLAAAARGFTALGEAPVLILASTAAAAWLLLRGNPRHGFALIGVTLIGRGLVSVQKYSVGRPRPDAYGHLVPVYNPSFPSGHAANSMIVYLTIAIMLTAGTRWARPAVAAAAALSVVIGLSRTILGVHWPSDVIGGWSFGLLWVLIALPLAERLAGRAPRR